MKNSYMLKLYSDPNFTRLYTELLSKYASEKLTQKESILAYTPGRLLLENMNAYISMNYNSLSNPSETSPMLSCTNRDDAIKVVKAITDTAEDIVKNYGEDISKIIEKNLSELNTDNIILHNYIVPQIIACVAFQLLTPIVSFEENYIK